MTLPLPMARGLAEYYRTHGEEENYHRQVAAVERVERSRNIPILITERTFTWQKEPRIIKFFKTKTDKTLLSKVYDQEDILIESVSQDNVYIKLNKKQKTSFSDLPLESKKIVFENLEQYEIEIELAEEGVEEAEEVEQIFICPTEKDLPYFKSIIPEGSPSSPPNPRKEPEIPSELYRLAVAINK